MEKRLKSALAVIGLIGCGAVYAAPGDEQRQTISALGTLAAGLAGGLAGDSAGAAVTGAQAGKNAVENNELFNLPSGLNNYGLAQGSLMTNTDNQVDENGKALPGMTL